MPNIVAALRPVAAIRLPRAGWRRRGRRAEPSVAATPWVLLRAAGVSVARAVVAVRSEGVGGASSRDGRATVRWTWLVIVLTPLVVVVLVLVVVVVLTPLVVVV